MLFSQSANSHSVANCIPVMNEMTFYNGTVRAQDMQRVLYLLRHGHYFSVL
jgi:hypothetical protein